MNIPIKTGISEIFTDSDTASKTIHEARVMDCLDAIAPLPSTMFLNFIDKSIPGKYQKHSFLKQISMQVLYKFALPKIVHSCYKIRLPNINQLSWIIDKQEIWYW